MALDDLTMILQRLGQALEGLGVRVELLVLFGSRVAGTATETSDFDVLVVSPSFEGLGVWQRAVLLGDAVWQLRLPIEAVAVTPEEWTTATRPLVSMVKAQKNLLYRPAA